MTTTKGMAGAGEQPRAARAEVARLEALDRTTRVIERSADANGDAIATIRTSRGDEFVVRVDSLALAVADTISDERHEHKMGWDLQDRWYRESFDFLRRFAALSPESR